MRALSVCGYSVFLSSVNLFQFQFQFRIHESEGSNFNLFELASKETFVSSMQGFTEVTDIDGGYAAWTQNGLPTES